jgi:hypothetical protein
MNSLDNSGSSSFEGQGEQLHEFFKTTEELVEWVMRFLTADQLSEEPWNEEVYFTIPPIEE